MLVMNSVRVSAGILCLGIAVVLSGCGSGTIGLPGDNASAVPTPVPGASVLTGTWSVFTIDNQSKPTVLNWGRSPWLINGQNQVDTEGKVYNLSGETSVTDNSYRVLIQGTYAGQPLTFDFQGSFVGNNTLAGSVSETQMGNSTNWKGAMIRYTDADGKAVEPDVSLSAQGYDFVKSYALNGYLEAVDAAGNMYTSTGKYSNDGSAIWKHSLGYVGVDSIGNVYFNGNANAPVTKLDQSGNALLTWGTQGEGDGQFISSGRIATDTTGNIYVVDGRGYYWDEKTSSQQVIIHDRILKFKGDGTFILAWGGHGTGDGQFDNPSGIAVDGQGNVYVADSGNYRIQKFVADGTFVTKWGSQGTADGQFGMHQNEDGEQFSSLGNIAADIQGNIYAIDGNRVQKFTTDGVFVTKWASLTAEFDGDYIQVTGIGVDQQGKVYIQHEWCVGRILIFEPTSQ